MPTPAARCPSAKPSTPLCARRPPAAAAATGFAVSVDCAGAAANYWLVRWLLRDVVAGLAPGRVAAFAAEMQRHRANLLHYNLFIRTAPIFPRWGPAEPRVGGAGPGPRAGRRVGLAGARLAGTDGAPEAAPSP